MKRISLLLLLVVLACGSVMAQNKALSLDGNGDYVEIPNSEVFDITDEITMEAWVTLNGTDRDAKIISRRPAYEYGSLTIKQSLVESNSFGTTKAL